MPAKGKKAGAAPKKKANGYKMPPPFPPGEVLCDVIAKKKWKLGPSIGVGGFGEIYSACDFECSPKKGSSFPFIIKIEPIENGPLFVEKHFYVRNTNKEDIASFMKSKKLSSLGMPAFYGSASHEFNGESFRFLVLERYGSDIWKLFKEAGQSFPAPTVFQLGLQMLDVLEYIHSKGYVHADIKGANVLLGLKKGTENQAYLVDFGLASRVVNKEQKPDPKCAHNGTIEYTSRDAHVGMSTMRGDLEILGYNMLQWLVGELPWEKVLTKPPTVHTMKKEFMSNVRSRITKDYPGVPDALIKFFEYVNTLQPNSEVDFTKCQPLFETYLKSRGKTRTSKLEFTSIKKGKTKQALKIVSDSEDEIPLKVVSKKQGNKVTRGRKPKATASQSDDENDSPNNVSDEKLKKNTKRKSNEPSLVVNIKKTKLNPKATPPAKANHANISTQTSTERRRSLRTAKLPDKAVQFDSPICSIIGEKPSKNGDRLNASIDVFEDSSEMEEEKVAKRGKPKRKLLSTEEVTVNRVVKKKVTSVKKGKWNDNPSSDEWTISSK